MPQRRQARGEFAVAWSCVQYLVVPSLALSTIPMAINTRMTRSAVLEEIGIELCNLKLGIRPRVPYVFFNARYWGDLKGQIDEMIRSKRAPEWLADYILFSDDPDEVVAFYRKKLHVL